MKNLILGALLVAGCGSYNEGLILPTTGATGVPACDPYRVGGNKKCSPREDGTADFVECATYPYAPDGSYQGDEPVSGCTLDFLASPGVPYTAMCVETCP
jgi:hypothetical protein